MVDCEWESSTGDLYLYVCVCEELSVCLSVMDDTTRSQSKEKEEITGEVDALDEERTVSRE